MDQSLLHHQSPGGTSMAAATEKKIDEPDIAIDWASQQEMEALTSSSSSPEQQAALRKADPMESGFLWYTPPMAATPHKSADNNHEWIISGHDYQVLTMTVPAGETVTTEVGTFFFGSSDIKTEVEFTLCQGNGGGGGGGGCNRICGGESCVKVNLTNDGSEQGHVGLTPNFPAKIIPIQFGTHIPAGNSLIAHAGAYMAQLGEVEVSCDLDCGLTTCCCAGLGCCRQKLTGEDQAVAFLAAGGTLVYKLLEEGERVTVDSHSVVAFEDSVGLGIASNGRFCMCCFGGEGCCSTTLTGPGKVFLQSMNYVKFKEAVTITITEEERGGGVADAAFDTL